MLRNKGREFVKCVVIGDTGVGKTKLISSKVNKQNMNLDQLIAPHIPTVWAMDPHRYCDETVDGVNVSITIWDTFGDHKNDRCFSYASAHVIIICYSAISRRSLDNAKEFWGAELQRNNHCDTPLLLVACKNDLRSIFSNPNYKHLLKERPHQLKLIKAEDFILPYEGRAVADEIGAYFYETNVVDRFGVDEVFENAIRAALMHRRHPRIWSGVSVSVLEPKAQLPMLPPKPCLDIINAELKLMIKDKNHYANFETDLSKLLYQPEFFEFSDCLLKIDGQKSQIFGNALILSAGSKFFQSLLIDADKERFRLGQKPDLDSYSHPYPDWHKFVQRIHYVKHPIQNSNEILCIELKNTVNDKVLRTMVHFLYSGSLLKEFLLEPRENLQQLKNLAKFFDILYLARIVDMKTSKETIEFVLMEPRHEFLLERNRVLYHMVSQLGLFCDMEIVSADFVTKKAPKILFVARCEFFKAMFMNDCVEKATSRINLPDVNAEVIRLLLQYFCTDGIINGYLNIAHLLSALEISDRFCLANFKKLIEIKLIKRLEILYHQNDNFIDEVVYVLERANIHNANNLAKWCLNYLRCSCFDLSQEIVDRLSPENREFLEINGWPPKWYFEELDHHENRMREWKKLNGKNANNKQQCLNFHMLFNVFTYKDK